VCVCVLRYLRHAGARVTRGQKSQMLNSSGGEWLHFMLPRKQKNWSIMCALITHVCVSEQRNPEMFTQCPMHLAEYECVESIKRNPIRLHTVLNSKKKKRIFVNLDTEQTVNERPRATQ